MKKQMKLREIIFITIILITTGIVVSLVYVSNQQFTKLLTERMVGDYEETASTLQKNIEALFTYGQDFAKYMSLDQTVLDTIEEYENMSEDNEIRNKMQLQNKWNQFSIRLLYSTSMLYSLDIYAGEDLVYSYYEDPIDEADKNIPKELLRRSLDQSSPMWTKLLTLRQYRSYAKKDDYGFAVVKSVKAETGQRVGAIAVYVRESSFSDILTPEEGKEKNRYYLVGGEDTIFSAVDKKELYNNVIEVLGLTRKEYEKCMQDGMLLKKKRGEVPTLYVSRSVDGQDLKLICETNMVELGEQQASLRFFTAGLLALSIALAIAGAWFVSKRVTKPLNELMDVMGEIKKEDKRTGLRFQGENTGEIGILGNRFNEMMDQLDAMMDQVYLEQRQRRHNELRLLQAQISPHFLYNTMGIISSFIKLGMTEQALITIQNLVSFYRLSLSSGNEIITVEDEMELIRNYMELQRLRYIEYMEYTLECEENIGDFRVPKLTVQPLVENILHHGLKPNGEKCQIHISAVFDEQKEKLRISVTDNGAGMTRERLEQVRRSLETGERITKSFGVLNVNQRLKLLYGERYYMEIDSVEGEGTRFTLYLPKEEKQGEEGHV